MLLSDLKDLPRACEWASKCDEAAVWSELAHAQLAAGQVCGAGVSGKGLGRLRGGRAGLNEEQELATASCLYG